MSGSVPVPSPSKLLTRSRDHLLLTRVMEKKEQALDAHEGMARHIAQQRQRAVVSRALRALDPSAAAAQANDGRVALVPGLKPVARTGAAPKVAKHKGQATGAGQPPTPTTEVRALRVPVVVLDRCVGFTVCMCGRRAGGGAGAAGGIAAAGVAQVKASGGGRAGQDDVEAPRMLLR
jgi:hypothetical protein